jgi:hypothetical protein
MWDGGEEVETEDTRTAFNWSDVLHSTVLSPQSSDAVALGKLLGNPPPLGQLKATIQNLPQYQGVPTTAPPRKNRIDWNLFQAQKKMEAAMHMQMHFMEQNDKKHMAVVAALTRSAWEDINQNRRALLAGKQAHRLQQRQDNDQARLLTKEEEEKIKPRPKFNKPTPTTPSWIKPSSSSSNWREQRSRSSDRWETKKGKGKGKGKGQP